MEGFWSPGQILLKGPCIDLLGLTCSELQHWGSSLKGTRDIWGGTELSDIRASAGWATFFQTEVLTEVIVPFLSPPTELAVGCHI